MNQTQALLIMLNNYFHDVATALLLASGVTMWVLARKYARNSNPEVTIYFLKTYKAMTRLALFSLAWIIVGGIPRTIFYKDFEWANAAGKGQVEALIVKHIFAFIFVGGGAFLWIKLGNSVKRTHESPGMSD